MSGGKVFEDSVASLIDPMVEDQNEQKQLIDAAKGKSLSEQRRFREFERAVMISKMDRENTALFRIRKEREKEKKDKAMRVCAQYTGGIRLPLEAEIRAEEEKEKHRLEALIEFVKVTDKKSKTKAQEKTPCTNNECKYLTKRQKQATVFRTLSEGLALKKEQIEMEKQKEAQMEERKRHAQLDLETKYKNRRCQMEQRIQQKQIIQEKAADALAQIKEQESEKARRATEEHVKCYTAALQLKLKQQEQMAKERNAATNKDMQAQWNTLLQQNEENRRLEKQRDLQLLIEQSEKDRMLLEQERQKAKEKKLKHRQSTENTRKLLDKRVRTEPQRLKEQEAKEAEALCQSERNVPYVEYVEQQIHQAAADNRIIIPLLAKKHEQEARASNSQALPLIVPQNRVVLKDPPKVTKEKLILPRIEPKTAKPIIVTELVCVPLSDRVPVYLPQGNLKCTERRSSKYSHNLRHKFRPANNTYKLQQDLKASHYKPSPPPKALKTSHRTE